MMRELQIEKPLLVPECLRILTQCAIDIINPNEVIRDANNCMEFLLWAETNYPGIWDKFIVSRNIKCWFENLEDW